MSALGYLLGGTFTGMAGLTTAVLLADDKSLAEDTADLDTAFTPSEAAHMDVNRVISHLHIYRMTCHIRFFETIKSLMECLNWLDCSLPMPDDGLFTRLGNKVSDIVTTIGRKGKEQDLRKLAQRIEGLYQQYRPIFVRANRLLAEKGIMGVSLKDFSLAGQDFTLNNAAGNEDWGDEITDLQDVLDAFVTKTTEAAQMLASRLEAMRGDEETDSVPSCASM